jgi:carbamoyltransferase
MIKSRDFWKPFAPSMLKERAADYMVNPKGVAAPCMILWFDTTGRVGELPATIHPYDRSARPLVQQDWNPDRHHLIREFERRTGRGVILNTSFNLHASPIAHALGVLKNSGREHFLVGHFLVHKRPGAQAPA